MLEKVALEHSSKSTKYELEGSYGDPVHEHFSFLKTAKLPRECNEVVLVLLLLLLLVLVPVLVVSKMIRQNNKVVMNSTEINFSSLHSRSSLAVFKKEKCS